MAEERVGSQRRAYTFGPGPGYGEGFDPASVGMVKPPASAKEKEERKEGWKKFMGGMTDRIANDPQLRTFLFTLGTQLMQPRGPQQTRAGHLGQAMQRAYDYSGNVLSNVARGQRDLLELQRRGAETAGKLETAERRFGVGGLEERKLEQEGETAEARRDLWSAMAERNRALAAGGGARRGATQQLIERTAEIMARADPGKYADANAAFMDADVDDFLVNGDRKRGSSDSWSSLRSEVCVIFGRFCP